MEFHVVAPNGGDADVLRRLIQAARDQGKEFLEVPLDSETYRTLNRAGYSGPVPMVRVLLRQVDSLELR